MQTPSGWTWIPKAGGSDTAYPKADRSGKKQDQCTSLLVTENQTGEAGAIPLTPQLKWGGMWGAARTEWEEGREPTSRSPRPSSAYRHLGSAFWVFQLPLHLPLSLPHFTQPQKPTHLSGIYLKATSSRKPTSASLTENQWPLHPVCRQ